MPGTTSDLHVIPSRAVRPSFSISASQLWLSTLALFIALAASIAHFRYLPGDLWVSHRVQDIHSNLFAVTVGIPETIVSAPVAIPATALLFVALWAFRRRGEAALVAMVPAGTLLGSLLKELLERPRPSSSLVDVRVHAAGDSFPSGHVLTAVLLFGLFAYLGTTFIGRAWLRRCVQVAATSGVILTGLARISDGVHWLSDVYGAMLLGVLILGLGMTAQRRWRLRAISRRLARKSNVRVRLTSARWHDVVHVSGSRSGDDRWSNVGPRTIIRHEPCGLELPATLFLVPDSCVDKGDGWIWFCPHCAKRRSLTGDPAEFQSVRSSIGRFSARSLRWPPQRPDH